MKLKGLNSGKAKEITKCLKNWIKAFFEGATKEVKSHLKSWKK